MEVSSVGVMRHLLDRREYRALIGQGGHVNRLRSRSGASILLDAACGKM